MRKSAISFANIESEMDIVSRSSSKFKELKLDELVIVKNETLKANNINDYEAIVYEIMKKKPNIDLLREYIDVLSEKKDFKRLNVFYSSFAAEIENLTKSNIELFWHVKINKLVTSIFCNKDTRVYTEYKQFRSSFLFSPVITSSDIPVEQIRCKISMIDDLISNTFSKTLIGNRQFEKLDKTKASSLPYLDVETIKSVSRGESHILMLTDDNFVIGYGENSKGQLLPLNINMSLDRATYLPSINSTYELIKAKQIFAKDNYSGILGNDGHFTIFGEGWTDRYVVIENCGSYNFIAMTTFNIVLIDNNIETALIIDNSLLKDYFLNETLSAKNDNDICYRVKLETLEKKGVSRQIKKTMKEDITKISSGSDHVIFLTDSGKLYGFGDNTRNQLSYSKTERFSEIIELPNTVSEIIISVFAYNEFTLTVDDNGNCYVNGKISRNSELIRAISIS